MPPSDADLAALVDAVIETRPHVDTSRLTIALAALCRARDASTDAGRREWISLLVTLVMAVKHPLGEPPWDSLVEARASCISMPPT